MQFKFTKHTVVAKWLKRIVKIYKLTIDVVGDSIKSNIIFTEFDWTIRLWYDDDGWPLVLECGFRNYFIFGKFLKVLIYLFLYIRVL
jgi:hypothetical protein